MNPTSDWSQAKLKAYRNKDKDPNAYYYRFTDGELKKGRWTQKERDMFLAHLPKLDIQKPLWGLFSRNIAGRVGYQCRGFYHNVVKPSMEAENKPDPPKKKAKVNEIQDGSLLHKLDRLLQKYSGDMDSICFWMELGFTSLSCKIEYPGKKITCSNYDEPMIYLIYDEQNMKVAKIGETKNGHRRFPGSVKRHQQRWEEKLDKNILTVFHLPCNQTMKWQTPHFCVEMPMDRKHIENIFLNKYLTSVGELPPLNCNCS